MKVDILATREDEDFFFAPEFVERRQDLWPSPAPVRPHPPQEAGSEALVASRVHGRARSTVMREPPLEQAPDAGHSVDIQEDDGVRGRESKIERTAVVSIHDPLGSAH